MKCNVKEARRKAEASCLISSFSLEVSDSEVSNSEQISPGYDPGQGMGLGT